MASSDDAIRRLDYLLDEIGRTSETNSFSDVDYARLEEALAAPQG